MAHETGLMDGEPVTGVPRDPGFEAFLRKTYQRRRQLLRSRSGFQDLSGPGRDPMVMAMRRVIGWMVRALALVMVLLIGWGVVDVIYELVERLYAPPTLLLTVSDVFAIFGAMLVVLIGVEIFENIILYLREDVLHVELVLATALMAIARKVIVFDFKQLDSSYVFGTAAVILALGVTYVLMSRRRRRDAATSH